METLQEYKDFLEKEDLTIDVSNETSDYLLEVKHVDGYKQFDEIPIMTITMLAYFNGDITEFDDRTLWKINHFLPITRTGAKRPNRIVKKFALTYPGHPWLILTSNLDGEIRGLIKTSKEGSWPNSIMIDMSVPHKLINFKLSPDNIHMTGCKSVEMGKAASIGLLNYVNFINNCLQLINRDRGDARRIAYEILNECVVPGIYIDSEPVDPDGCKFLSFDSSKITPRKEDTADQVTIRTFMSMMIGDLNRYDQVLVKLDWILEQTPIFENDYVIERWNVALVKYRFSLGFSIDLLKLVDLVYTYFQYFFVDYHPMLQNYAKMEILDPHAGIKCKATAKHTFGVQANGNVTYNSPNIDNSNAIYNLFISTIDEIRADIEMTECKHGSV